MKSTRTRLNIVASGGLYGATLSVSATNLARLCHLSGPALPLTLVSVPSGTSVGYSIVYDGLEASESQDDIALTATVTENMTGMVSSNECSATSVRIELAAVWEAPEYPCTNRHVYGVMDVSFRGIAVPEVPCDEEDTITGCFTNGHRRTHTFEGGAGRAHPIKEGNFWFVDAAHIADTISNWQSGGELVWKIPVGWHRKGASDNVFYVLRADHEINLGYDTRPLVFKSVYSQRFHVDQVGTIRVDKFGHWTSRTRFCRVGLDGTTLQENHPTW